MTSFRYLVVCCIIYKSISLSLTYEKCKLLYGEQGYCVNIYRCASALKELKLDRLICGFAEDVPLVCCSDEFPETNVKNSFANRIKFQEDDDESTPKLLLNEDIRPCAREPIKFPEEFEITPDVNVESSAKNPIRYESDLLGFLLDLLATNKPIKFEDTYPDIDNRYRPIRFEPTSTSSLTNSVSLLGRDENKSLDNEGRIADNLTESTNISLNDSNKSSPEVLPTISGESLIDKPTITEIDGHQVVPEETTNSEHLVDDPMVVDSKELVHNLLDKSSISDRGNISYSKVDRECGRFMEYAKQFVPRTKYVTGGENADYFEFPHMAALGYKGVTGMEWKCGGCLISEQFVLTAAHCASSKLYPIKAVRLGDIEAGDEANPEYVQNFEISKIMLHPSYKRYSRYHDIALLQLDRPVKLSRSVIPACLQTDHDFGNETLWATGWGASYFTGDNSKVLQKVDLRLFPTEDCYNTTYGRQIRLAEGVLDDLQICAGNPERGKDTCQGDSGGPLQIKMFNDRYMYKVVGITSFGKGCGVVPAIYTRVSSNVKWIEEVVWPEKSLI